MTEVTVYQRENVVTDIVVDGHAKFGEEGQDIICAGISAICTTTYFTMERFLNYDCLKTGGDGYLHFHFQDDEKSQLIAGSLITGLHWISTKYPENISLKVV